MCRLWLVAGSMAWAGAAQASPLFDAFEQVCLATNGAPAAIAAATRGPTWSQTPTGNISERDARMENRLTRTSTTSADPVRLVFGRETSAVVYFPTGDFTHPVRGKDGHIQACSVSIDTVDRDALTRVKTWAGPELAVKGFSPRRQGTEYWSIGFRRDGAKLSPSSPPTSEADVFRAQTINAVVKLGPHPSTTLTYVITER
jgi:hypothetical protein